MTVARKLRTSVRAALKAVLDAIPPRFLVPLRNSYFRHEPTSVRARLLRPVVSGMRIREFDWLDTFEVGDRPGVRLVAVDSAIANHVYWMGLDGYEPGEVSWWETLCRSHSHALELGANIGLYTVFGALASPSTAYTAVEPNPDSVTVLRRNLELNGVSHVVTRQQAVAGEVGAGTAELIIPAQDLYGPRDGIGPSGGAYLSSAVDLFDLPGRASISVPLVAMADLVDGVDLIKMDIEGLELDVLRSVEEWITNTAPTMVIEVRNSAVHLKEFLGQLIESVGYRCYVVTDAKVQEVSSSVVAHGNLAATYGTRDVTLAKGFDPTATDFPVRHS